MACFMAVRMLRRKLMIIILTLFAFIEIYLLLIDDTKRGTDSSLSSFLSNDLNKGMVNSINFLLVYKENTFYTILKLMLLPSVQSCINRSRKKQKAKPPKTTRQVYTSVCEYE